MKAMRIRVLVLCLVVLGFASLSSAQGMFFGQNFDPAVNHIAVQNSCGVRSTTSVTTEVVALNGSSCNDTGHTPTAGNLEILYMENGATQTTPACVSPDSNGNTWSVVLTGSSNNRETVCKSLLSSTGNATVTVNFASGSTIIFTVELSGAQNSLDCTVAMGTLSTATSLTLPSSCATTNPNDIILGFDAQVGTSVTWSAFSPWTLGNTWSGTTGGVGSFEYQIVTATGTYAPRVTASSSLASAQGATVVVKSQ